jgi:N-acetylglucosaminyldiphosphoundecaprenol N-acetyl-beta-D-mannosaminyltransferase
MGFNGISPVSPARPLSQAACGYDGTSKTVPDPLFGPVNAGTQSQSNLMRPVYCILGMPIDAVNMATVVRSVDQASNNRTPLLLSTPNLNFLVGSLSDPEFRESLLDSDLCPPDGAPIVWIARLLGLPVKERVAGSDLLDELRGRHPQMGRLTVFLFGGAKGIAEAAARKLNAQSSGLSCVGAMDPGFCEVEQMSKDNIIDALNFSGADFLILALGAKKGQLWLHRNHHRLTIPIKAHLGAAINFQAGSVSRAPLLLRSWGLEWLWRIKEERYLWRRYRDDALVLLRLLFTRVLPLAVISRWSRSRRRGSLRIGKTQAGQSVSISLGGVASEDQIVPAISCFEEALTYHKNIVLDLDGLHFIDARFLGLLLMLRKELKVRKAKLAFTGVSSSIMRIFRLNELEFLLASDQRD